MGQSEFDRLEQFVQSLLEKYDVLTKENESLKAQLGERDEEVALLENELLSMESERGDVNNRIKALIRQIENWENNLGPFVAASESSGKKETPEDQIDQKEKIAPDNGEMNQDGHDDYNKTSEKMEQEKEGGTQQDLFHVNSDTNRFRME